MKILLLSFYVMNLEQFVSFPGAFNKSCLVQILANTYSCSTLSLWIKYFPSFPSYNTCSCYLHEQAVGRFFNSEKIRNKDIKLCNLIWWFTDGISFRIKNKGAKSYVLFPWQPDLTSTLHGNPDYHVTNHSHRPQKREHGYL